MGLQVLVRTRNYAEQHKAEFALVAVSEPVARVLQLTGLQHVFSIFPTLEAIKAQPAAA